MTKKLFASLKDSSTFIGAYLRCLDNSETPEVYDFWCAVWALGSIIGKRIYVDRPRAPVYLNWYVVLVAESGTTRKSTAVRTATDLVRAYAPPHADMIEGKATPEKLEATLALQTIRNQSAQAIISISELVTFMGRDRYSMAMPGLLTDLYDCPVQRKSPGSITSGSLEMRNVFVSLLTASTPTWLQTSINPDVVAGGFTSRCVFICADKPKHRIAWPTINQGDSNELDTQLTRLLERVNAHSRIGLSSTALHDFTKWYNKRQLHDDVYRSSFESREDAHVLRLAACLCINDATFQIESHHIKTATEVINNAKLSGYNVFSVQKQEQNRLEVGIEHLRAILIGAGVAGLSGKDLSVRMARYLRGFELRTALRIMHELALVQRFELRSDGAGRPRTVWRAAPAIAAPDATQAIKERYEQ